MVPIGDILPNLGIAPKNKRCWVCQKVAATEHVTAMCFDEQGNLRSATEAAEYLISMGFPGKKATMMARVRVHARHVAAYARSPYPLVPAKQADGIIRVDLPHANWLSATQSAVELGQAAQWRLAARLMADELGPKEEIALAKLGIGAGFKQGDLEAKGKSLKQVDRLLMLAAGLRPVVVEGEAREVE